jgi:cytochrome c551/c552
MGVLRVRKSLMFVAAAGFLALSATAGAGEFKTSACQACHKIDADSVGPSWKSIATAYGSADKLAATFKSGFKVEDRKMLGVPKFKSQAGTMTAQYTSLIKGHEEDAANALFAAVKAGKF